MSRPWSVPRIWAGDECVIVGGGPSVSGLDLESLRGRRVIAVNAAFRRLPRADVLYFGDYRFLKFPHMYADAMDFGGLRVHSAKGWDGTPGLLYVRKDLATPGISEDPTILRMNRSSGAAAINLAYLLGSRRLVLLGFDMKPGPDGRKNFHDDYTGIEGSSNPYAKFLAPFPKIAADLARLGCGVVNACPGSALTCFRIAEPQSEGVAACAR